MQSSSDPLKFSILYTLTALANPTGKVIDPLKIKKYTSAECKEAYLAKFKRAGTYDLNASGVIILNGLYEKVYQRILIKHRSTK